MQSFIRLIAVLVGALAVYWVATNDGADTLSEDLYQRFDCGGFQQPCLLSGRQYSVLVPRGDGPFPAVMFFNGSNGSGQKTILDFKLVRPFLERGFAFVAPTALEISYRNGPGSGWVWSPEQYGWNDFEFSSYVIEDALKRFPIDPDRILVAGHSRGGSFAWYLACSEVSPKFHAFAPINGTPVRDRPGSCATSGFAFDMFHTHGFQDRVIPFVGDGPFDEWPGYLGAVEVVDTVAHIAGCADLDITEKTSQVLRRWTGCSTGARVSVLGFEGGHVIPVGWAEMAIEWFENLYQ